MKRSIRHPLSEPSARILLQLRWVVMALGLSVVLLELFEDAVAFDPRLPELLIFGLIMPALVGAWGMQAQINDTTPIYITDGSPAVEATYEARFYFSPQGVSIASNKQHDLLVGRSASGTTIFRVQLRKSSGSYQLRGVIRPNSGSDQSTNWYTVSNASHAIEIAWQAATTPGGADGALSLWLDGSLKQTRSGVANDTYRLEEVRLGPSAVSSNTSGTEYFDAFASTRGTYIGP